MVTALAEFLRYSLLGDSGEGVELREELDAIRNYLGIEAIRYEENLQIHYQIESQAEPLRIPPFLVCPLVENAVKHGMRTSAKPLRLNIVARVEGDDLMVEISNTGTLRGNGFQRGEDTGTGVRNVRERVTQIYGSQGGFELIESEGWVRATLRVPIHARTLAAEVTQ
jgi:LytS/YehU family sensor histidine kinase